MEFKTYSVTGAGLTVNCREAGSGLPVVFLESLGWKHKRFYESMAQQFHLFILEFEDATAEGAEAAVREMARSLAGDNYSMVGLSGGANLALRTMLQAPVEPEPVDALVLISPTAIRPSPDLPDLDPAQWADRLLAHKERHDNLDSLPAGRDMATLFAPGESDTGLEGRLPEITCPTLVAFGTRDRMTAREAPSTYRAHIPNCHVSLIYDAAHLVAPERPEAVSSVVIDFIENRETFVVSRQSSVINP